jgi:hypothetical protein
MMQYTVERLVHGDEQLIEYYREAVKRWGEIWSRPESRDLVRLATSLSDEQFWFEQNCGGRWIGQEIMVVSGFGSLYTTAAGFDQNAERARRLYNAFQRGYCSIEIKAIAREVATSYGVLEKQFA